MLLLSILRITIYIYIYIQISTGNPLVANNE
jgi:hypothetical protein